MNSFVKVRLCKASGWTSRLIEYFGGGGFSHMATFLRDGNIIDATVDNAAGCGAGVQLRPGKYLDPVAAWIDIAIPCTLKQALNVETALLSQVGKPYDKEGILDFIDGTVYDRNWRDKSAWFCDELCLWSWTQASILPLLPLPIYRMTPGTAGAIAFAIGGKVVASKGIKL